VLDRQGSWWFAVDIDKTIIQGFLRCYRHLAALSYDIRVARPRGSDSTITGKRNHNMIQDYIMSWLKN
jgi:hypothetical protein